ncbi:MAG TPA: aminopeptidase, partial [Candidatus Sulfotelmatobacter sp.]|nr:aminopeptidase [Candidatus Sulfotelmatobacter sp.]
MMLDKVTHIRKWLIGVLLLTVVVAVSGCKTWSFYTQAFKGQYQIFAHEQSIEKLEASPQTPGSLKERFKLLEDLRGYARSQLALPVDGHYRKYVDVHRPYVVWNVEAAPEFSMEPKTWWYPLVGSLKYRGYFSKGGATNYAGFLRRKGYDVSVGGVQAYSTLGWFKDPVLNTFLFEPDAELAEIIFHELGHQRVFARGDTDFNEAFATTVGQEGARRWLRAKGDKAALEQYEAHLRRTDQFVHLVMETRLKLEALYGDTRTEDGKVKATDKNHRVPARQLRERKRCILEEMQKDYAQLKAQWNGNAEFDWYFTKPANNAQLNGVANYYDLVPGFEQVLARHGGNL